MEEGKLKDDRLLKTLRFERPLLKRINQAKGERMQKTGEPLSFQEFCMDLIDNGLKKFKR